MQPDQLPERITCLFRPFNEVVIARKPVMHRTRIFRKNHAAAGPFEPVSEFDVFHPVHLEVFVKAADV